MFENHCLISCISFSFQNFLYNHFIQIIHGGGCVRFKRVYHWIATERDTQNVMKGTSLKLDQPTLRNKWNSMNESARN